MSAALAQADLLPAAANDAAAAPQSLLRFITCGSVDDGKSTLIGRLLFEAGAVPDDLVATLQVDSAAVGNAGDALDYSLLVDGLQAEREQGITIDVAYRYFATPRRSFIVADTPGHEQYTRNMATGASGAELAVILIDARKGVLPQTRRHSLIVSMVGVRHVVVAINKIDLIGFDEAVIRSIEADYRAAVDGLGFQSIAFIPVSARDGDNIARRSERTGWYDGPTLLGWLEGVRTENEVASGDFLLPVQRVNRPDADFRGFSGTVTGGTIRPGDEVVALLSGARARVARIVTFDGDLAVASAGQAVTLTLDREIDVSRGDVFASAGRFGERTPAARDAATVRLFVTADRRISAGDSLIVQIGAGSATAHVAQVLSTTDVETFDSRDTSVLGLNDLGHLRLRFDRPLVIAPYQASRELGSLILVDRLTNATAAMGIVMPEPDTVGDRRVVALRRVADRTLAESMGPLWREEIAPATSWRVGSAILLGLIVFVTTGSVMAGLSAALLDAVSRPVLRLAHKRFWKKLRERASASRDIVSEGGGI